MSSILKRSRPPDVRALSHANKKVRALPRCWAPVGEGANLATTAEGLFVAVDIIAVETHGALVDHHECG